jgi:hypothetical protein
MGAALHTEQVSEPLGGVQPLGGSGLEQGRADTPFAVPAIAVTPGPAHHYSEGVIVPGRCAWCGMALYEHVR